MKRWRWVVLALAVSAGPATAQNQPATTPVRVAGSVVGLDGDTMTVNASDGATLHITLDPGAAVYGVEKRSVADIKPGDFLASGGVRGADGRIHAVEVRILPEALRGSGEGQRPWAVKPAGVMTNATVTGTVDQSAQNGTVHVRYKDGESEYDIGPDVPVVAYVAGDRELLKPGAAVFLVAQKKPDGSLTAGRVTAEKNGVKPPM